jgi:FAD/FMN-containing dehydrogenase
VLALERFHGAVTRVDPGATAYQHRAPGFNLLLIAQWADDGQTEECVAWARSTFDELSPFTRERSYVNHLGADDERVRPAYGANLPRLAELKRRYHPANLFRLNQNIRPSTQPAAIRRARLGAPTASS